MTEHKWAKELRAIADGKEVEWYDESEAEWEPLGHLGATPLTHENLDWRIKPEKKVLKYRVALMKDKENYTLTANSEDQCAAIETWDPFIKWLHDWQLVEVE